MLGETAPILSRMLCFECSFNLLNSIRLLLLVDDFLGKQPGALAWPGTDIAEPEVL